MTNYFRETMKVHTQMIDENRHAMVEAYQGADEKVLLQAILLELLEANQRLKFIEDHLLEALFTDDYITPEGPYKESLYEIMTRILHSVRCIQSQP